MLDDIHSGNFGHFEEVEQDDFNVRHSLETSLYTTYLGPCLALAGLVPDPVRGGFVQGLFHATSAQLDPYNAALVSMAEYREQFDLHDIAFKPELFVAGGTERSVMDANTVVGAIADHFRLAGSMLLTSQGRDTDESIHVAVFQGRVYVAFTPHHRRLPMPQWAAPLAVQE